MGFFTGLTELAILPIKIVLFVVFCFAMIFGVEKFADDTIAEKKAQSKWTWHRICKNNNKRAEFILNCVKEANPMSNEEREDLVKQCQITSYDLFCEYVKEYY